MPVLLEQILAPGALTVRFQPLIALEGAGAAVVYGAEGLIRGPAGTNLARADVLFEYVRRKSAEVLADRTCVRIALAAAGALPKSLRLSLNVHALTLAQDREFSAYLFHEAKYAGISTERLTVEIVEHAPDRDLPDLRESLVRLRAAGVKIAIDDLGSGAANFRMLIDLRPECLKIDRYFVTGVHADDSRAAVVRAVRLLADSLGAEVIGEGVETLEEARRLLALGVARHQGFLYCRPVTAEEFPSSLGESIFTQERAAPLRVRDC